MRAFIPAALAAIAFVTLPMAAAFVNPAAAALDTNAVAAFYANGTYRMVTWDEIDKLNRRDRRYVSVAIFHVQSPGDYPNAVVFNGADEIALKREENALIVREIFLSPSSRKTTQFYEDTFDQEIKQDWSGVAASVFVNVRVHMLSRAFGGPYDDLTSRAAAAVTGLRFDPVPSEGEY
jgi:hypothetical protein